MTPLTKDEAAFAAEHHRLVYAFLCRNSYAFDDYYDIVVFGFLRAVSDWHKRDDLREQYQFSTIAFKRMRASMSQHFQSMNRLMRSAPVCRFEEQHDIRAPLRSEPADTALNNESVRKALTMLTPRQREVACLRAAGLNNYEIGARYGITHEMVRQDMLRARERIMRSSAYDPELMAA